MSIMGDIGLNDIIYVKNTSNKVERIIRFKPKIAL